ncbi:hypothetical protein ACXR2T_14220 [Leucobacter sp. HY1910]
MSVGKTTTKFAGVLCAAALAFTLSACSGGQSVAEACKIAEETVSEAQSDMQSAMTEAMTGEGDFGELFSGVNDALVKAEKQVNNAEVSQALKDITADFGEVRDVFKDFKMPDMTDFDYSDPEAMADFEEISAELEAKSGELEAISSKLEKSSAKLQELCTL